MLLVVVSAASFLNVLVRNWDYSHVNCKSGTKVLRNQTNPRLPGRDTHASTHCIRTHPVANTHIRKHIQTHRPRHPSPGACAFGDPG
jgi:hypothetical protein